MAITTRKGRKRRPILLHLLLHLHEVDVDDDVDWSAIMAGCGSDDDEDCYGDDDCGRWVLDWVVVAVVDIVASVRASRRSYRRRRHVAPFDDDSSWTAFPVILVE